MRFDSKRTSALLIPVIVCFLCACGTAEEDILYQEDQATRKADNSGLDSRWSILENVDHEPFLLSVRNQGFRPTCHAFALAAALEGYYGLQEYVSVEPLIKAIYSNHIPFPGEGEASGCDYIVSPNILLPVEGNWPYKMAGSSGDPSTDVDAMSQWSIGGIRITNDMNAVDLQEFLSKDVRNNVVAEIHYERLNRLYLENRGGVLVSDGNLLDVFRGHMLQIGCVKLPALNLGLRDTCQHDVLLVGFRKQSEDGIERTYFKFRDSYGPWFGKNGYAWFSSEDLGEIVVWTEIPFMSASSSPLKTRGGRRANWFPCQDNRDCQSNVCDCGAGDNHSRCLPDDTYRSQCSWF